MRCDAQLNATAIQDGTTARRQLLNNSPRPHPPRRPPGAVGILSLEARQFDARVRTMNEGLLTDVHPDVRNSPARLCREQKNITRLERLERRSHESSGARLVA